MNYFKGVCACALALVTVFIAPLIIKYFVEGWSPLNYFKPQSHQYKDALSLIKKQASIENPDIPDAPENREELDLGPRGM